MKRSPLTLSSFKYRPGRRSQQGFTLIEVLVAVTIIAITIATVYGVFASVSTAKNKLDAASEIYQSARVVFDRFGRELHGAYLSSSNRSSIFQGGKTPDGDLYLELSTTTASPLSSQGKGFALIKYTLVEDTEAEDGSKVILRTEQPLFQRESDSAPTAMRLVKGIRLMTLRYYADAGWHDSWDSKTSGMPEMVEMEIRFQDGENADIPFLSAFTIPEKSQ